MLTPWLLALALTRAAVGPAAPDPLPQALSLDAAVSRALSHSPAIHSAEAAERASSAQARQARAPLLPQLNYSESFSRGDNPVYAFGTLLNQRRFSEENFAIEALNNPDPLSNFQSQFVLEQLLFDWGRWQGLKRAKLGEAMAGETRRGAEMGLVFEVVQAYFGVLTAEANLKVIAEGLAAAEASLERAQAMFDTGMATEADVLSLRVRISDLSEQRIRAHNMLRVTEANLNRLLGDPLDRPRRLTTTLEPRYLAEEIELGQLEQLALEQRPDVLSMDLMRQSAELARTQAKARFLPQLALRAGWQSDRESFAGDGGDSWFVGVSLRLNLFNGLADWAALEQTLAELERSQAEQQRVSDAARLEVRRAWLELDAARQRVEVARGAVGHARETLRIVDSRYQAGLTDVTELLRSQSAVVEAEARELAALYEQRLAAAGLDLAVGRLGPGARSLEP